MAEMGRMCSLPIGGTGPAMTHDAVIAWARDASPRASIVYALGHLPCWAKGPKAMRMLADRRLVDLHCDRSHDPKRYVAVRTSKAWPREGLDRPSIMRVPRDSGPEMARLLEILREDAAEGLPCRSNAELAMLADLRSRDRVKYLLGELERAGAITRRDVRQLPGRIVTISATGASTGTMDAPAQGLAGRRFQEGKA